MRLGRKNLGYSLALAGTMLLFLVGYFIYMLPSLYVDHVREQNLRSIREQHEAFMKKGSYEDVKVKNATACFSVKIPREGDSILVTGKAFSARVTFREERLRELLDRFREMISAGAEAGKMDLGEEMEPLSEIFQEAFWSDALPVNVEWLYLQDIEEEFFNETAKVHAYSDDMWVMETGIEDSNNRYANYIAVERTEEALVFSVLPVIAPDVDEIRPVVLQSLPMLCAVILLVVLLFSGIYSRGIVSPIEELVRHTQQMKDTEEFSVRRMSEIWPHRKDEVRELADTLDDLYQQIRESYQKLEEKNRELGEENRRQEIFLRASSHQLKTPIAAALLLTDGMMNEVGRYKDTKAYLPKVKEQLLSMRKMVEDILYLNHCAGDMKLERTDVGKLLQEKLRPYQVVLADRHLALDCRGTGEFPADTDERMAGQILDNVLSNAVKYTPRGGRIQIDMSSCGERIRIRIENFGVRIPEELLPHIFEPFVSGSQEEENADMHSADVSGTDPGNADVSGINVRRTDPGSTDVCSTGIRSAETRSHGLGLYIASYFARKMGVSLTVRNGEESVITDIVFRAENAGPGGSGKASA